MKNLLQFMTGDSHKSGIEGTLTIEIANLKMTRTVGCKHVSLSNNDVKVLPDNHDETVQIEMQNLKMNGEINGTLAGFFKVISEMGDQLKPETDNIPKQSNQHICDCKEHTSKNTAANNLTSPDSSENRLPEDSLNVGKNGNWFMDKTDTGIRATHTVRQVRSDNHDFGGEGQLIKISFSDLLIALLD